MEGTLLEPKESSSKAYAHHTPVVLLADDDLAFADALKKMLSAEGYEVLWARDADSTLYIAKQEKPDLALIDVRMPGAEGLSLLRSLVQADSSLPVLLMTGYGSVSIAVEAIRDGAYDFIEKPLRRDSLLPRLQNALSLRQMQQEMGRLREEIQQLKFSPIVGRSPAIRNVLRQITSVAVTPNTTVLLQGESGTGKELVARAIHDHSERRMKPFIAINCAALTESLLEAELFGYEKGAFTGASPNGKQGLFVAADGGTIFLDEISELASGLQAKLLRVLQERNVRRVGGERDLPVNVRVIASTNRDLQTEVQQGRFRQDLFFRLHVMSIELPPLRDRREDLPLLSHYFLEHYNKDLNKELRGFSSQAMEALSRHSWPGNVRELRNAIERAAIVARGSWIEEGDLSLHSNTSFQDSNSELRVPATERSLRGVEKALIQQVLGETRGNISRSATLLGINRTTLYNKMKLYGVEA